MGRITIHDEGNGAVADAIPPAAIVVRNAPQTHFYDAKIVEQGCIFVCLLSCSIAARKSLPYQPGSHTVIRKHRTDQAETVTPLEAKSSHRSAEYCTSVITD